MREIEIQATISRSLYREMVYFQMFRKSVPRCPLELWLICWRQVPSLPS